MTGDIRLTLDKYGLDFISDADDAIAFVWHQTPRGRVPVMHVIKTRGKTWIDVNSTYDAKQYTQEKEP